MEVHVNLCYIFKMMWKSMNKLLAASKRFAENMMHNEFSLNKL